MAERENKADEIAKDIAAKIANKTYPSHASLPSIRDLSKQYKVSPATISRALDIIESLSMISTANKQLSIVNDWNKWRFDALALVVNHVSLEKKTVAALMRLGLQFYSANLVMVLKLLKKEKLNKEELLRLNNLAWENRDDQTKFVQYMHDMIQSILISNSMHPILWVFNDLFIPFTNATGLIPVVVSATLENWDLHTQMLNHIVEGQNNEAVQVAENFFKGIELFIETHLSVS